MQFAYPNQSTLNNKPFALKKVTFKGTGFAKLQI